MRFLKAAAVAVLAAFGHAEAASTFTPARPPATPLAVRSPYLSVWLEGREGSDGGYLPGQWPKFWSRGIQGWQGFVMVDGDAYNWMGGAPGAPNVDQTALEYTSTKTIYTMNVAGKVQMRLTFLSPVYADDLRRQSVTFSYLDVAVKSLDGRKHNVQIYSDVSGEWASGDTSQVVEWEHGTNEGVQYHKFWRQNQNVFGENNEIAAWGNRYWTIGDKRGVTYQIGEDTVVRGQFLSKGRLTGEVDKEFRAVQDRWPVFAFSRDLGAVGTTFTSTLFTVGYAQEDAILFQGKEDQPRKVPALWTSYFTEDELIPFFYNDYDYATHSANRLDIKVQQDSMSVAGKDYATITTLAVRQAIAALQYTGTEQDPIIFLKEISSNSDIATVDVIFPPFPLYLYLNPDLIRYNLRALLENDRYKYPNSYAQHDLGTFPKALGHPQGNDEEMPLEECGNMIIMMLAYAQKRHNYGYLSDNYDLLTKWAGYLIDEAKIPANQLSTDDFAGHLANQTNLAIKGIIGLEAMSQIAHLTGHKNDVKKYSDVAHDYLEFWQEHGINHKADPPHTVLQYDASETYGLLYNIYADKALGLNFIPQSIYDMQSDFYLTKESKYGVILDTRNKLTKVDWEMFCAAVAKPATRKMFISKIAQFINETPTTRPFTDIYDVNTGLYGNGIQFNTRPVIGGVFAPLALKN